MVLWLLWSTRSALFLRMMLSCIHINSIFDVLRLQEDLEKFCEWILSRGLHLNLSECRTIMVYSRTVLFHYNILSKTILRVDRVRDNLGGLLESRLAFDFHLDHGSSIARMRVGFFRRVARCFRNIESHIPLFQSLVLSILNYSSIIWTPYQQNRLSILESAMH